MPRFDELFRRPFLAFSGQPDLVGPQESHPPQGPTQLLESPDAEHGGKVAQDALVPGVNNSPAAHLQGKVVGGATLPLTGQYSGPGQPGTSCWSPRGLSAQAAPPWLGLLSCRWWPCQESARWRRGRPTLCHLSPSSHSGPCLPSLLPSCTSGLNSLSYPRKYLFM